MARLLGMLEFGSLIERFATIGARPFTVRHQTLFCYAALLFAAAFATASFGNGLIVAEGAPNIFIRPSVFAHDMLYTWTNKLHLGEHFGFVQVYATPFTWLHMLLINFSIPAELTQRIVIWLIYASMGCGMYWTLGKLDARLSLLARCAGGIAYILNPYVAFNSLGSEPWLLTYAALPVLIGALALGLSGVWTVSRCGAVVALLVFLGGGINPPLIAINVVVVMVYGTLFVIRASDQRLKKLARLAIVGAVCTGATALLNAYWVIPFLDYIHSTWLGGLLDESPAMHNADSSFVNVMRGLGQWGTFVSTAQGQWYPWSPPYHSGFFAFSLWLVPMIGFAAPLFRRSRTFASTFFLCVATVSIPLVVGYYHGAVGQAVTAPIYDLFYNRMPGFQMFRSVYKWVGPYEFAICGLFSQCVNAGLANLKMIKPSRPNFWLVRLAATIALTIPIVAFWPIFINKTNHSLLPLPAWFDRETAFVGPDQSHRVALMPTQYLERFAWGNPTYYVESAQIDRPLTFGTLEAARYETADQFMRRAYRSGRLGDPTAADWFRAMSVNDFLQRDDFISIEDFSLLGAPALESSTLAHDILTGIIGAKMRAADGPNKLYRLGGALPLIYGVDHPSVFPGPALAIADHYPVERMARGEAAITCDDCDETDLRQWLKMGAVGATGTNFVDDLATSLGAKDGILFQITKPSSEFEVRRPAHYNLYGTRIGLTNVLDKPEIAVGGKSYKSSATDLHMWKRLGSVDLSAGRHSVEAQDVGPFEAMLIAAVPSSMLTSERVKAHEALRGSDYREIDNVQSNVVHISLPKGRYLIKPMLQGPTQLAAPTTPIEIQKTRGRYDSLDVGRLASSIELPYVPSSGAAQTLPTALPDEWYERPETYRWNRAVATPWIVVGPEASLLVYFPGKQVASANLHLHFGAFAPARLQIFVNGRRQGAINLNENEMGLHWGIASTLARQLKILESKDVDISLKPGTNRITFVTDAAAVVPSNMISDIVTKAPSQIDGALAPDTSISVIAKAVSPNFALPGKFVRASADTYLRPFSGPLSNLTALRFRIPNLSLRGDPRLLGAFYEAGLQKQAFLGFLISPEKRYGRAIFRLYPLTSYASFDIPLAQLLPDSPSDTQRHIIGVWALFVPQPQPIVAPAHAEFAFTNLAIARSYILKRGTLGARSVDFIVDGHLSENAAAINGGLHTIRLRDRAGSISLLDISKFGRVKSQWIHLYARNESPVHITVHVPARKKPFLLVLNQTYEPRWQAHTENGVQLEHVHVNGFANGWLVPANSLPTTIDLNFTAQGLYRLAALISFCGLICLVVILAWPARKRV